MKLEPETTKKVPRIATLHMRKAKGGMLQGINRQGKLYTVDTTPAHAKPEFPPDMSPGTIVREFFKKG